MGSYIIMRGLAVFYGDGFPGIFADSDNIHSIPKYWLSIAIFAVFYVISSIW